MTTFSAECVPVAGQRMRLEGFPADDLHAARAFAESTLPAGALLLGVYEEPPGGCAGCPYQNEVLELDCHEWLLVRFIDTPKGTEASYNGVLDPELCLRCVDEETVAILEEGGGPEVAEAVRQAGRVPGELWPDSGPGPFAEQP